jgi:hypothetical protein
VDLWQTLWQIVTDLGLLLGALLQAVWHWGILLSWLAWWLWGANWKKIWPTLAEGAWAPVVLLAMLGALVWSQLAPTDCSCLGFVTIANFWWQLGGVGLVLAATLFCGWLQGYMHWEPAEIPVEPATPGGHGHGYGHEHGHGHGHH